MDNKTTLNVRSSAAEFLIFSMQDWAERINKFLLADDRDILENAGKISMEITKVEN